MAGAADETPGKDTGYTVSDLVNMALRQIGVGAMGTTASAPDIADGVMHLNMMLAQWQRKRWLVPNLVDEAFLSTGASVYYIGPGGSVDVSVRPAQVLSAYARLLNGALQQADGDFSGADFVPDDFSVPNTGIDGPGYPIDYSLTPIPSYEDYAALGLKALRTWPSYYHYNPAFPLGSSVRGQYLRRKHGNCTFSMRSHSPQRCPRIPQLICLPNIGTPLCGLWPLAWLHHTGRKQAQPL